MKVRIEVIFGSKVTVKVSTGTIKVINLDLLGLRGQSK